MYVKQVPLAVRDLGVFMLFMTAPSHLEPVRKRGQAPRVRGASPLFRCEKGYRHREYAEPVPFFGAKKGTGTASTRSQSPFSDSLLGERAVGNDQRAVALDVAHPGHAQRAAQDARGEIANRHAPWRLA